MTMSETATTEFETLEPDYSNPRFLIQRQRPVKHGLVYDWYISVQTPDGITEFPAVLGRFIDAAFAEQHMERSGDNVTWELGTKADGRTTKLANLVDHIQDDDRLRLVRVREHDRQYQDYTVEVEQADSDGDMDD
jgi:hypothetical protein